jgi:hypothetical protein
MRQRQELQRRPMTGFVGGGAALLLGRLSAAVWKKRKI